jgi:hypothetical protein
LAIENYTSSSITINSNGATIYDRVAPLGSTANRILEPGASVVLDTNGTAYSLRYTDPNPFEGYAVTFTVGTNVTSVTCTSANCDLNAGSLSIVGGTAGAGTVATVNYTALATAPRTCVVSQNGGATWYGLGHASPSATSFAITAAVSVASTTLAVDYSCKQ